MSAATDPATKPEQIKRVFKGVVDDVDTSKRTVTSIITTDAIDRHKEVILPKGIDLANFTANPIVLWCHDLRTPIGKNLWIKRSVTKRGLIAQTLFGKTELAEEIFQLYVEEILNGWSIGARPDWASYSGPTPDEIKARPELKGCYGIIRKCELVEYSAVSIPANPEALGNEIGKSISKSIRETIERSSQWEDEPDASFIETTGEKEPAVEKKDASPLEETKIELPPLVGRSFEQVLRAQQMAMRILTSDLAIKQATQDSLDRLKGRV